MSLLLATLLVAVPQTVPAEDEIVVIGRRLAAISAIVSRDARGKLSCSLSESSGDRSIDGQLCKTAAQCVGKGAVDNAAVHACIDKRKPAILADFAARRRAEDGR